MIKIIILAMAASGLVLADASYRETTTYQGGTMVDMVRRLASTPLIGRLAGGASKMAFDDQACQVFVKGNKLAKRCPATSTIFDLDAGTVTTIDNAKRSYSTMTFDEMQAQAKALEQRMNKRGGDVNFDVKVENTGNTREIDGEKAQEVLLTMKAKEPSPQGQVSVITHSWLIPLTESSREVLDFHRKLSQRFANAFAGSGLGMGIAANGMSQAMNEISKQDGYPALSEMEVSGVTAGGPMSGSDPNAPLIKMSISSGDFLHTSLDDSKFQVPNGYSQRKK